MKLTLVDRPAVIVVGLQIRTLPMSPDIPALWPRFVARIPEIAHPAEARVTYGVMRQAAGGMNAFDYLAAVSVAAPGPVPAGMTQLALPAGLYAFFSYPLSGLGAGFGEIFERLLPQSGFVQRLGPFFERYNEDFCPDRPESAVEIYLPVAPKD